MNRNFNKKIISFVLFFSIFSSVVSPSLVQANFFSDAKEKIKNNYKTVLAVAVPVLTVAAVCASVMIRSKGKVKIKPNLLGKLLGVCKKKRPEIVDPSLVKKIATGSLAGAKVAGSGVLTGAKVVGSGVLGSAKLVGSGVGFAAKNFGQGAFCSLGSVLMGAAGAGAVFLAVGVILKKLVDTGIDRYRVKREEEREVKIKKREEEREAKRDFSLVVGEVSKALDFNTTVKKAVDFSFDLKNDARDFIDERAGKGIEEVKNRVVGFNNKLKSYVGDDSEETLYQGSSNLDHFKEASKEIAETPVLLGRASVKYAEGKIGEEVEESKRLKKVAKETSEGIVAALGYDPEEEKALIRGENNQGRRASEELIVIEEKRAECKGDIKALVNRTVELGKDYAIQKAVNFGNMKVVDPFKKHVVTPYARLAGHVTKVCVAIHDTFDPQLPEGSEIFNHGLPGRGFEEHEKFLQSEEKLKQERKIIKRNELEEQKKKEKEEENAFWDEYMDGIEKRKEEKLLSESLKVKDNGSSSWLNPWSWKWGRIEQPKKLKLKAE